MSVRILRVKSVKCGPIYTICKYTHTHRQTTLLQDICSNRLHLTNASMLSKNLKQCLKEDIAKRSAYVHTVVTRNMYNKSGQIVRTKAA